MKLMWATMKVVWMPYGRKQGNPSALLGQGKVFFWFLLFLCLLWTRHSGGILNTESQKDSVNHSEVQVFKGEIDARD